MARQIIKLLYIEDELVNQLLVEQLLADAPQYKYEMINTDDGLEAMRLVQSERPDILLVDMNVPNLKGGSFIALVRQKLPDIPIVVVTGDITKKSFVERYGVDAYILKPLDPAAFPDLIGNLADRVVSSRKNGTGPLPARLVHDAESNLQIGQVKLSDLTVEQAAVLEIADIGDGSTYLLQQIRELAVQAVTQRGLYETWLGVIGHELRTPYASLKGFHDFLMLILANKGLENDPELVAVIPPLTRSVDRMGLVVDRLVRAFRLVSYPKDKLREEANLSSVDLNWLAEQSGRNLNISERSVVYCIGHVDSIKIMVDADYLLLAVRELVVNGLKYTSAQCSKCGTPVDMPGARRCAPCTPDPRTGIVLFEARLDDDGTVVKISIKDDGVGIPPNMLHHVREPFVAGTVVANHSTGNEERYLGGGMGIGLYLARMTAEMHGGQLVIESHDGRGTTATLHIPVKSIHL